MLILTRRVGENLKIFDGENLKEMELQITLLDVKGMQARIGIDCKDKYIILREEVYLKYAKEKNITPMKEKYNKQELLQKSRAWKHLNLKKKELEECREA